MSETEGRISLEFKTVGMKTVLQKQYYKLPLQVLPPHYQDDDGTAFVYLLNPTGGIIQGDRFSTEIKLGEDARVLATTTSANKIYRMDNGCRAEIRLNAEIGENAQFEYLPLHTVPYSGSSVRQNTTFHVRKTSTLIAWDNFSSGRRARGESFDFNNFESTICIYEEGALIMCDRIFVSPKEYDVVGLGMMEGKHISGGVYLYHDRLASDIKNKIENMFDSCGVIGGMTTITPSLGIIRILAEDMISFGNVIDQVWALTRNSLLGKDSVIIRRH